MTNRTTNVIVAVLLVFVFVIAVASIRDDSFTFDETAHVAAGYSYLTQKDYRLNQEHPPLIKDLAAFPLLFLKPVFPGDIPSWTQKEPSQWWTQFDFATNFLYRSGNDPDKILLFSRIPMILILILLGFFIFKIARELFGNRTALLALFLFSFSPTFLGHGRLVTTDVGAALGVLTATYYFIKALQNPTLKNIIIAGIVFGIAELLKFSLILLIPFFVILAFIWGLVSSQHTKHEISRFAYTSRCLCYLILIMIIGYILVWGVYLYHTWNYPLENQIREVKSILSPPAEDIVVQLAEKPILRPLSQYLLGVSMVFQRVSGGNTAYFMGEVSSAGWKSYFPVVYAIKEPLAFHILLFVAILLAILQLRKIRLADTKEKLKSHFLELAMLLFIVIYWIVSIKGNLNIGVRHLLPVFPFTILLVSKTIIQWFRPPYLKTKKIFLLIMLLWQIYSVINVYPYFLTYFNELAGGPENGYKFVVDSNLDWGQDLKRLTKWIQENKIDKIYLDYFGGGNPEYYLKEKYAPWKGVNNPSNLPDGSYLAVSVSQMQGGRAEKVKDFNQNSSFYKWLNHYTPVAEIGHSIFVYRID